MKSYLKMGLVLMAFLVMFVAVGCSGSSEGTTSSGADSDASSGSREVVKIIVPYGVGGTADAIGRKYAQIAGELYPNYSFVVEQKTGGDGFVGAAYFESIDVNAKELLLFGYGNAYRHEFGNRYGTEQVPFDMENLKPLAAVDDRTWILYGNPGDTLEEVFDKARAGDLRMSGGNPLSDPHLALGSLVAVEDGSVTVVGYDGGAAQKLGLINGEVDVFIGTTQAAMGEVEAGDLVPMLAFSEDSFDGLVGPDGPISVPGLVNDRHPDLGSDTDYSGSILPAGGFLTARTGTEQAWEDKVIEISKAVWATSEFRDWKEEIGLNHFEIYGDDAQAHLDDAVERAINAFELLK
ncbi:hypothetical protein [Halalkalibacter alkaliphilus]|uniref:Tripartite tricarboxylate transporter substrate binding protein n=1 Tax=Halalkalibacter alkaliphilus TaxID=2917993 RepID=A0A9X2CVF1_9BACI|nr:hypothetical protein [Halalkalibacter alkaliphilus]MCL7748850.1 hypothetical protein [Halalkalibacter alkaliphilus]